MTDDAGLTHKLAKMAGGSVSKDDLDYVVKAAREHKPPPRAGLTYDEHVEAVRMNYEGCQAERLRGVLAARYPGSGLTQAAVPLNITTETAELAARSYRQPPERWLEVDGVRPGALGVVDDEDADPEVLLPEELPRLRAFDAMVKLAGLAAFMQEVDRIVALVRACVLFVRWSKVELRFGRVARPELVAYWPSQVSQIPGEGAAGKIWAARALLLHDGELGTKHETIYLWLREPNGTGWRWGRYTREGRELSPLQRYTERDLPAVLFTERPLQGRVWPEADRDLLAMQDEVNVGISDHWHGAAYNSHKQPYVIGGGVPKEPRRWGPDHMLEEANPGTQIGQLDSDYNNLKLEGVQKTMTLHGLTRRLPVDAFERQTGNPETGVARLVRNIFSDQKRAEHVAHYEELEAELLRVLARVTDHFGNLPEKIDGEGVTYHARFAPPRVYEDPTQRQQRLKQDRDDGIISEARYGFLVEHYPSEEAAVKAGLSRFPKPKPKQAAPMFGTRPEPEGDGDGGGDGDGDGDGDS